MLRTRVTRRSTPRRTTERMSGASARFGRFQRRSSIIAFMSDGRELVIGLVGAIGTDLAYVSESLERHLKAVGYSSSEIRVSHLLHVIESYAELAAIQDKELYYDKHMD